MSDNRAAGGGGDGAGAPGATTTQTGGAPQTAISIPGGANGAGANGTGANGAAGGGAQTRGPDGRFAPAGGANGAAAGAGDGAGAGGGGVAWGESWRADLARGDETRLRRLERYASPDAIADALFSVQDRIRTDSLAAVSPLPENATADEIAAHRKVLGVPDKPDGYGLAWPDGKKPSDRETARLAAYQEFMHNRHVPPTYAKAAFQFAMEDAAASAQQQLDDWNQRNNENIATLRNAWPGREYDRNITIAQEFLGKAFEGHEEALDLVLGARLPDGTHVGNYAPFLTGLVQWARSVADEEALHGGDGSGGGKSIDDEYRELVKIPNPTREQQARALELAEARQRRLERQGRGSRAA